MNLKKHVLAILNEEKGDIQDFLTTRKEGAAKIQQSAEEKGGASQLTATHFAAKAKPYEEAIDRSSDLTFALEKTMELLKSLSDLDSLSQNQWQALTGQLEAYGEIYIAQRDLAQGKHLPGATARVPEDFDAKALAQGTDMEMEHTSDREIAQSIAMDHLAEDPDYYVKAARRSARGGQ
jgi:hypothetical protein